jgi:hypothetical protein
MDLKNSDVIDNRNANIASKSKRLIRYRACLMYLGLSDMLIGLRRPVSYLER